MATNRWLRGLVLAGLWLGGADVASSEPVTLKARDGGFQISGEIVSSNAKTIALQTPVAGLMVLDTKRFECIGAACPASGDAESFSIQGSNTIGASLMPALIEAYAASQNRRVEKRVGATPEEVGIDILSGAGQKVGTVDLRSHGSGTAFPALAGGTAEIGASSRPVKPEEEKLINDVGLQLGAHVLALDGILILVSPDNPVSELTLDQVAGIFSGQITDWSQVGGQPGKIVIYARDEKSGTADTFGALVMSPRKLKLAPSVTRKESSTELSDLVTQDPSAIGFAGFAYLRNAKALSIRGVCGVSFAPTAFNVKTEEYPLARRLFLYTTSKMASQEAKSLLTYALSDAAQPIVLDTGFIDQSIDQMHFRQQPQRIAMAFGAQNEEFNMESMKQLVSLIGDAQRMSVTYRFETNESQLDLKARQDIFRLARLLERPDLRDKEILLVGYADSAGTFATNLPMSQARAETVRGALLTAGGDRISPKRIIARGYSETMPVDCNDTAEGRAKNRRVEVWVRNAPRPGEAKAPVSARPTIAASPPKSAPPTTTATTAARPSLPATSATTSVRPLAPRP